MDDLIFKFFYFSNYILLAILFGVVLPTAVPCLLWNERLSNAFFVATVLRFVVTLHATFTVNSLAHLYGSRPYDRTINPRQNLVVQTYFWLGDEGGPLEGGGGRIQTKSSKKFAET